VTKLVEFRAEDALRADISAATVVTLYMLPWFNERMKPNFQKMLKPGTRIVSHDFGIEGWQPDKMLKLPGYELKPADTNTSTHFTCGASPNRPELIQF
jgi:hypothetical protein